MDESDNGDNDNDPDNNNLKEEFRYVCYLLASPCARFPVGYLCR